MFDKETQKKIRSCKALQDKSIWDLVQTRRFRDNLAAYMAEQREARKAARSSFKLMHKMGGAIGLKLPAHPVDQVIDLSVKDFAAEFIAVITHTSKRPFAQRQYIDQLGKQAYNLTVAQYVVEEYPELEPVLIPKAKAN